MVTLKGPKTLHPQQSNSKCPRQTSNTSSDRAEAFVGQIVRFDVRVGGTPYPHVEWFHEKSDNSINQLTPGPKHKFIDASDGSGFLNKGIGERKSAGYYHSLVVGPLMLEDCGIYCCTVSNENGQASAPIELTVFDRGTNRDGINFDSNYNNSQAQAHSRPEDFLSWSVFDQEHNYNDSAGPFATDTYQNNPPTNLYYYSEGEDKDQGDDMLVEKQRRYYSHTSRSSLDEDYHNHNPQNQKWSNNRAGGRNGSDLDKREEYYVTIEREDSGAPRKSSGVCSSSSRGTLVPHSGGGDIQQRTSKMTRTTRKTTKIITESEPGSSGPDTAKAHAKGGSGKKTVITIGIKGRNDGGVDDGNNKYEILDRKHYNSSGGTTTMRIDRGEERYERPDYKRASYNDQDNNRVSHFYSSRYEGSSKEQRPRRQDRSLDPARRRRDEAIDLGYCKAAPTKSSKVVRERRELSHSVERDTYHWLRGDEREKPEVRQEHKRADYSERTRAQARTEKVGPHSNWAPVGKPVHDRQESYSYTATCTRDLGTEDLGYEGKVIRPTTIQRTYDDIDKGMGTYNRRLEPQEVSYKPAQYRDEPEKPSTPLHFENPTARAISPARPIKVPTWSQAKPAGKGFAESTPPPQDFSVDDSCYSLPSTAPKYLKPAHPKRGTVPPEFIQPFKPVTTVTEGDKVRLQALIKPIDDPTLKVDWYIDGRPVPVGSRHKTTLSKGHLVLEIEPASKGDAGNYLCILQNPAGMASCPAALICEEDDKVEYKTENPEALEKIKKLETTGNQKPEEPFTPIYYYPPTPVQEPLRAAPDREPEPIEILCQPRFITHFKPIKGLPDGNRAYFEARYIPTDDADLQVEWLKDGKPMLISSRINTKQEFGFVSLDINPAYASDSGVYSCRISNKVGSDITKAALECLEEKPERFTGTIPPPTYVPPPAPTPKPIIYHPPPLQSSQMPSYLPTYVPPVQVSAPIRTPQAPAPPKHYLPAERQRYVPPASAPAPIPKIRKHPQQAPEFTGSEIREETIMGTLPLYQYEQGPYMAPAPFGPPRFLTPFKNIASLREGARSHFEARLEPREDPKLTVEWLFNGKPIIIGSRHHYIHNFGFVALDIYPTYAEDSGTYICVAKNQYGQAVNTATLVCYGEGNIFTGTENPDSLEKILELERYHQIAAAAPRKEDFSQQDYGPPMFLSKPKDLVVKEGDKAHFEAAYRPTQDPTMKIEWLYNGLPMKAGSRFKHIQDFGFISMDVADCLPEDSGLYTIVLRNQRGLLTTDASLLVSPDKSIDYGSLNPDGLMKIRALESHHQRREGDETDSQVEAIAPRFLTHIKDINNVPDGDSIHFEAKLIPENDPLLKVQWFFNGQPLRFGSRFKMLFNMGNVALEIHQISYTDSGLYECRAWNKYGEDWTRANLTCADNRLIDYQSINPESFREIQKMETIQQRHLEEMKKRSDYSEAPTGLAPKFTSRFTDLLDARQGDSVYFEARLEPKTDPNLVVEWYKDNQPLPLGCRITTLHNFGYVALKFSPIFVEDNGIYVCRAVNNFGEDFIAATLKCQGESLIDTTTLNPESLKEVARLEAHYDASQHVTHVNGHGDPYAKASLEYPRFLNEFGSVRVNEGDKACFKSKINPEKDANLRVEWFLNGQTLIASDRYKMLNDFGYVGLSIISVAAKDIGTYECRLSNTLGTASNFGILKCEVASNVDTSSLNPESMNAICQLEGRVSRQDQPQDQHFGPPVFVKPLYGDYGGLKQGQIVRLEAFYEPFQDPKLMVEILKDGEPIITGSRFKIINEFGIILLEISDLTSFDSGVYEFKISNALGQASCKAELHCTDDKVIYDKAINPDALKQIQKLEEWEHRVFEKGFDDPTQTNGAGSGSQYPAPLFLQDLPPQISLGEGQRIHLEARIEPKEDPDLKVEWLVDGRPIPTGNRFRTVRDFGMVALDIMFVYPEDSGDYTCRLSNKQGIAELKTQLNCIGSEKVIRQSQLPHGTKDIEALEANLNAKFNTIELNDTSSKYSPKFVRQLTDKLGIREGQRVNFECRLQPARDPNMSVAWLKNGVPLIASNRMNTINDFGYVALEIAAIFPEDEGNYSCVASNPLGQALTSAQLTCQAIPKVISDAQYLMGEKVARSLDNGVNTNQPDEKLENQSYVEPTFIQPLPPQLVMNEDNNAVFEIQVDPANDPNRIIKWYKNGNEIDASNRINIVCDFGFLALYIKGVREDDTGIYTCRAVNPLGEAMTSSNLFVRGSKNISHESMMPDPESTLAKIRGLETWESMIDSNGGARSKLSQRLSERKSGKAMAPPTVSFHSGS